MILKMQKQHRQHITQQTGLSVFKHMKIQRKHNPISLHTHMDIPSHQSFLVSIIVPVYKVEDYLQECIDSIKQQTYSNWELILVNDGSPDGCSRICDNNASTDPRIKVIHQNNQGVTQARANGVTAAGGEFITFVDGDDTLQPYALKTLMDSVQEGIDIVLGKNQRGFCPVKGILPKESYREQCVTHVSLTGGPWAKLYRRYLFDNKTFDIPRNVRIGEDDIMNIRIAYNLLGQVYSTDTFIYNYRDNPDGAIRNYTTPEYVALYQKYRLMSIPQQDIEKFLPKGLANDLIIWWLRATTNRIVIPRNTYEAHRYLLSIRKHAHRINFGFLSGILFRTTNPVIRFVALILQKSKEWVRALIKGPKKQ